MSGDDGDGGSIWMDNLCEWIFEDKQVVTYRWISKQLKIHVNIAKQMLFAFLKKHANRDVRATYLIAGKLKKTGNSKVQTVNSEDLEQQEALFSALTSKHVYSVSSGFGTITSDLSDSSMPNKYAAIGNKKAVPRPRQENRNAIDEVKQLEIKKPEKIETEQRKPEESNSEKSNPKKPNASGTAIKKAEKPKASGTAIKKAEKSKASGTTIAGMFAKAKAKAPVVPKVDLSPETSPGKENFSKPQIDSRKRTSAASGSASCPKRRKRIQMLSDSDSDEDHENNLVQEAPEEEAPPQTKLIESESEDEDIIPPTPELNKKRRRLKKQVSKTYQDEDGYLCTKKELQSCSESDEEDVAATAVAAAAAAATIKSKTETKSLKVVAPNKQAKIMNFFKRR